MMHGFDIDINTPLSESIVYLDRLLVNYYSELVSIKFLGMVLHLTFLYYYYRLNMLNKWQLKVKATH